MLYLPHLLSSLDRLPARPYRLPEWREVKDVPRILLLNLMPLKEVTEWDIVRTLDAAGIDAQVIPVKISGQTYKTTPMAYMEANYLDFECVEPYDFERMIITGAPLEQMPFEEVRYWPALCRIMRWADRHVRRTLYICWGAQAGLYCHYGVNKYGLEAKCFGIFSQDVLLPQSPLMRGLSPRFLMPNSRHTEVRISDLEACGPADLQLLAASRESGVGVVATKNLSRTFIVGHLEYEPYTLDTEYRRDLSKGLPILPPRHYYGADGAPVYSWQRDAEQFYRNWCCGTDE